jgi:hypothetical protein
MPITLLLLAAMAQEPAALPARDRVRLAEVFRLAAPVRGRVWPGWSATPMPILLVTDSVEYLVGLEQPAGFRSAGYDTLLQRTVWVRKRTLDPTLAATFPAVGGMPTIVVGSAERLGKSSTTWVLTVFHENFHQMQYRWPGYYPGVARLGLSGGDSTGTWMLNYPFPYDSAPVQDSVRRFARSLARALTAPEEPRTATREALVARDAVRAVLSSADGRYLDFQLWQEGVPRYIELAVARAAAETGEPAEAFRRLPDYEPYAAAADRARKTLQAKLEDMSLGKDRRVSFYPLGAGLALVLDRARPNWKAEYFLRPFEL